MKAESRTKKSIRNSTVAMVFYVVNLALQFFSRKVFIDYLGVEILGLNTTAASLLQFLNLAELGIGNAVAFTLYKPLQDGDHRTINEIISLQGWLYRKIALVVLAGSVVLMAFFPSIFKNSNLPLWYAYATYSVLLVSALLSYYFNYRQILLSASQQDYKLKFCFQGAMIAKVVFQIALIPRFGYIGWLALELIFAIIATFTLNAGIRHSFPMLTTDVSEGKRLKDRYPVIITKIKQIFFHKIGSYALTQSSPIVIYAYASLTVVGLYGNYMLIINGVRQMLEAMFDGMNASVGDLVAEGNKERIIKVFRQLFAARFLIIVAMCFALWSLTNPFICLWIGSQYLLPNSTLFLIIVVFYLSTSRAIVNSYIHAYGLFGDVWSPIAEAALNVGLSILFGYYWGLNGILLGVIVSLLVIVFSWKPYYLFVYGIKTTVWTYVRQQASHLIAAVAVFYLCHRLMQLALTRYATTSLIGLQIGVAATLAYSALMFASLYCIEPEFRVLVKRFKTSRK